jgi:hypothetical protein
VIHSQKECRYRTKRCGQTFSATKGTALYRVHKPHELVTTVVTLLAYGCPVQAIVAAFDLDERTIHRWQHESGRQCQRVHEHIVQAGRVLLAQVQADELRVRVVGGVMWLASALSVTSRLWLGGVVQIRRDRALIRTLLEGVRACGTFDILLLCTDGLAAYPKQALKVFSAPLRTGKRGRPRLLLPEGLMVAQAIKRYARRRVTGVVRRIVRGTETEVGSRLRSTQGATTRSSTPPTSSDFRPPFAPGWLLWCAGCGRRRVRGRRWRWACGWWAPYTTSAGCIALCTSGVAPPGSGDGSKGHRPRLRGSLITTGRLVSCLAFLCRRLHPSGADDDRGGCWRPLMLPDYPSTVEWGTTSGRPDLEYWTAPLNSC